MRTSRCLDAIEVGANSYVVKDDTARSIIEAVRCAAVNQNYLPPLIAKRVMGTLAAVKSGKLDTTSSNGSTPLSHRELNVQQMMAEGARNREIADVVY